MFNQVYNNRKSIISFAENQISKNADVDHSLVSNLSNSTFELIINVNSSVKDFSEGGQCFALFDNCSCSS
jgi:hypothetical protein